MKIEILPFTSSWLPDLTTLINSHIIHLMPGWVLLEDQVASVLTAPYWWNLHYHQSTEQNEKQKILCAFVDGHLSAAAQVYFPQDGCAYVGWIVSDPQLSLALTNLLEKIINHACQLQCQAVSFSRYGFGVGWMDIPTIWPHLVEGIQKAGFVLEREWVLMSGDIPALIAAASPVFLDCQVKWHVDPTKFEWEVAACLDEIRVGECQFWGIPSVFRGCPGYDEWITLEWISIEEPYRRKGIGRWLITEQLKYQAQRGVRHVLLWTETDNFPLKCLAEEFGFRCGPICHQFSSLTLSKTL